MRLGVIVSLKRGLDHFVYRELQVLSAHGTAIRIFPTKYRQGLYNARQEWQLQRWHPLTVIALQPLFFLRAPIQYLRLLYEALTVGALMDVLIAWYFANKMHDVDVIYAQWGDHKLFIGYFCKKILNKPLAVVIHSYELYRNPNPRLFVRALAACNQVITISEHNKELLASRYKIPRARVQVIRAMVDTENYQPADKFIILIVAFFGETKGHAVLFQAIQQLAQKDIEVWVVGGPSGGITEVNVRALATEMQLDAQVAFFGALSGTALKAVYQACDVFCLPCHEDSLGMSEGFPVVLMEAMAFGKPVITTRHTEIPRMIPEILVEENDVEGLARAIQELYQSPERRRALGAQNRKLAEQYFSTHNAELTLSLLQDLAETRDRHAPAFQEGLETSRG